MSLGIKINQHKNVSIFIIIAYLYLLLVHPLAAKEVTAPILPIETPTKNILVGAAQLAEYLPLLEGKKVGLVVNQTSVINNNAPKVNSGTTHVHLVDLLIKNGIDIRYLFAPEHGIRGMTGAGEKIDHSVDEATGIPIISIYGKEKKPSDTILASLDIIVFDIQDVGARFYTYISSMHYMMEAANEHKLRFIVLDRPNPNGMYIDGPVLDMQYQSFVGMHPIPILHGLTVGELALMIKGENWIDKANELEINVIPVKHYSKSTPYSLPIAPSPNLPNDQAIQLYASLCFFEATAVSVGRGTDFPFQVIGHNKIPLGEFLFTPVAKPFAAPSPKLMNTVLQGVDLRDSIIKGLNLSLLITSYHKFASKKENFFTHGNFMDKLSGTDKLRRAILQGQTEEYIRSTWQADLNTYKLRRKPYLLYPD